MAANGLVLWQMPTVGEQLRAARVAKQLRVQEVAEATKMRSDHILALEEGNYAPFPAPVYVRGSVRTYAKLLQLDVMPIMNALAAELSQDRPEDNMLADGGHRRGVLDFLALHLARFGWKRTVVVLVVLAALGVILLIGAVRPETPAEDPLADLPPPTYHPASSTEGGYLSLPGTNQ